MKIATSDIEANDWIKLSIIGFYDGSLYKIFPSVKKYLDFVLTKKYSGYRIYFHNGGKYDFLFLIEDLLQRGSVKFITKASGLLMLKYSNAGVYVEFADSYALLPASLESLIDTFEISDKKISVDFTVEHNYYDSGLRKHLENDCISLYKILMLTKERQGFLSLTVAAQALRVFREKYFNGYIWNVSDNFDFYFRTHYYKGGRVEVYKGYGKNLYYYDVNSLYPSVMLNDMPIGKPKKVSYYKLGDIGFYHIEVKEKTNFQISPFIFRTSKLGNYYVNSDRGDKFYMASCELELLKDFEIKFKILEGYKFEAVDGLFNEYVEHFYNVKKAAVNKVDKYIAKMMLNSLYGKFGQQISGQNIETNHGQKGVVFDCVNDLLLVDTERNLKFRGVYLAAYITALARIKHLRMMYAIGSNHIWYCDTDSIITDKKMQVSNEIGELKLEAKISEGVFLMPKTYGYKETGKPDIVHYKGFTTKDFTYNNLKSLLSGTKKELSQKIIRVLGFRESIKRINNIKLSKGTYLKTAIQEKILTFNYTRRKIIQFKKYIFITIPFYRKELQ